MKKDRAGERQPNMAISILSGAIAGAALSVVLILVYALALKQGWLEAQSIAVVNTVIKLLSSAVAALYAVRRCDRGRWVYGAFAGLVYTLLAFLVFSALSHTFSPSLALLSDVGMGMLCGMLTAMLVGLRR